VTRSNHLRASCVVILAALTVPAVGQFGLPTIVYDPTASTHLIAQLGQMEQQYAAILNMYRTAENTYSQIIQNAKTIANKQRWESLISPWSYPVSTNTYGTTSGWTSAMNTGSASLSGYQQAVVPLGNYSSVWNLMNSTQQAQAGQHYATVELTDGVAVNALNTTGTVRANAAATNLAISTLQSDSLSDDPNLNTEVGVLNKVNAANLISAQTQQDTNKLLAVMVDQQAVQQKAIRDGWVESVNANIAAQQMAQQNAAAVWSGTTQAHSARLP
jgi:hypothetical protein